MAADLKKKNAELVRRLERDHGMTVTKDGQGHWKVSKGGASLTIPSTPSDRRGYLNGVSRVRKTFGIDVRATPNKRKSNMDDFAAERLRARLARQHERFGFADLARLTMATQDAKRIPGFKTQASAAVAITRIIKDGGTLTATSHNALAAMLNTIENAADAEVERRLDRLARADGTHRAPRHAPEPAPAEPAPEPAPEPVTAAEPERGRPEEPSYRAVRVELGFDAETRSLLRELVVALTRG